MADIHSKSEDRLWSPSFLPALLLQVFELLGEELPDATSYLGRLMKAKKNREIWENISSFIYGFVSNFEPAKIHG